MAAWLRAEVREKIVWNDRLFSLRITVKGREQDGEAVAFSFTPGQFVRVALDIDDERIARPYSLVNIPGTDYLEIYFNIVPEGPLSPQLALLEPGDELFVSEKANGFLVVDEVPENSRHLWMMATGTGVGPFLSILNNEAAWLRFEKIVLIYSVRDGSELCYRQLIAEIEQRHPEQFCFIPVVTREQVGDAVAMRIPQAIQEGIIEQRAGIVLDADSSHVMMCGNSAMIADVSECLNERGMKKHLRRDPGHLTTEKYH